MSDAKKSALEQKVDGYVSELVALDARSPEFGKQVDAITNMGRKEIMAASSMSNRFLDRPVRAMDQDGGVGSDLTELRRTVEELDPGRKGKMTGRKFLGIIPIGGKLKNYFDSYTSAQGHIQSILARLSSGKDELLMDNAAIDVERTEAVGGDGQSGTDGPHRQDPRPAAGGAGRQPRCDRSREGQGDPRDGAVLRAPAHAGPAHADGGQRAGLPRARLWSRRTMSSW